MDLEWGNVAVFVIFAKPKSTEMWKYIATYQKQELAQLRWHRLLNSGYDATMKVVTS